MCASAVADSACIKHVHVHYKVYVHEYCLLESSASFCSPLQLKYFRSAALSASGDLRGRHRHAFVLRQLTSAAELYGSEGSTWAFGSPGCIGRMEFHNVSGTSGSLKL